MLDDTIVAIATPPGEGSIGIIRISGSEAIAIGMIVFRPKKILIGLKKTIINLSMDT
ncbi:hypothetical protein N752_08455 [Desulforamulus aquiferis]|nr:hypothetical protein N752_08455 [Desulforamulus aquiferis]